MKKGFTLVELLAVLLILSIILGVAIFNTNYFTNQRKNKDYDNIVAIILENTDLLVNTNNDIHIKVNEKLSKVSSCKISYKNLIDDNLMDDSTINPKTNKVINLDSYIKVTLKSNYDFNYEFIDKDINDTSEEIVDCLSVN